jgi:pimeloyl-ACP methyl ester carboxylesterase
MGGDRHHPLVVTVADGLAAAGVAALRLDLRDPDVGTSASRLVQELADLPAELAVERRLLVGYSWGAAVAAAADVPDLAARVLVAPPVTMLDLESRSEPALVLVPAHDQYGPPAATRDALAGWPDATVEVVDGCDHFLAGAVDRISDRAVAWLTESPADTADV